jgi:AraC-like DNA-binding protein
MQRNHLGTETDPSVTAEHLRALFTPYRIRPTYRPYVFSTSLATACIRTVRLSVMQTRHESVGKALEDSDFYSISFAMNGQTQTWMPGLKEEISTYGQHGRIFQRKAHTITIDGDNTTVMNLWIPSELIRNALQATIGDAIDRDVEFSPRIDAGLGAGTTVLRSMLLAAAELGESEPSFTHPLVAARFEDYLAHTLLSGLQHSFTDLMAAQHSAAAPRSVIRALDFMRAHAAEPLTIADIAASAACSTRAIQLAFRAWRDTTPMRELTRIRLLYAHADLMRLGPSCTITQIALKWGFGHPGRFAQQYARIIGQSPSHTQRFGMVAGHRLLP